MNDPPGPITAAGGRALVTYRVRLSGSPLSGSADSRAWKWIASIQFCYGAQVPAQPGAAPPLRRDAQHNRDRIVQAAPDMGIGTLTLYAFSSQNWARPVDEVTEIVLHSPVMIEFRKMLFAKIVPNVKRLGLLTPWLRERFAEIDILKFEHEEPSA